MLFCLAFSNYVFFFPSFFFPFFVETLRPIFFSSICSWLVAKRSGICSLVYLTLPSAYAKDGSRYYGAGAFLMILSSTLLQMSGRERRIFAVGYVDCGFNWYVDIIMGVFGVSCADTKRQVVLLCYFAEFFLTMSSFSSAFCSFFRSLFFFA